jgi:hypothetical protein
MSDTLHRSKYGTYHPSPGAAVAWTVNDTQDYIDGGPACDECGACDCDRSGCGADHPVCACACADGAPLFEAGECIGLSFAYVCLDGGDSLCADCWAKAADVPTVIDCDCA